jgi:3-oxoacyl-[acyl-carrier-protein] synthase II
MAYICVIIGAGIKADDPELKNGRCGVAFGSSMGSIDPLLDFYSMLVLNDIKKITATTYIFAFGGINTSLIFRNLS